MLSANKFETVKKELERCKNDDLYLVTWIYPFDNPQAIRDNPNHYQPTISDAINEIANYYGDTYEEYQAISDALNELLNA